MNKERLNALIEKEEENLKALQKKKSSIEKKIETATANLDRYKVLKNNECYKEMLNAANQYNITLDNVIEALYSGNLQSIQDVIDQKQREETRISQPEGREENSYAANIQ